MSKKQRIEQFEDLDPLTPIRPFVMPNDEGNFKATQRFASYGKNRTERKIRANTYRIINDIFRPKNPQGKKNEQEIQKFLRQMAFKKFER